MSVSLKESYDIAYDGSENAARMDLFIDTSADLAGLTHFDTIKLLQGSTAEDISTGDKYMMQTGGTWVLQPNDYVTGNYYTKTETEGRLSAHVCQCDTAGNVADKVVSTSDNFVLREGTIIIVKFSNPNSAYDRPATPMTINVNDTGAFRIYYGNGDYTYSSDSRIYGGSTYSVYYVFRDDRWVWLGYTSMIAMTQALASAGTDTVARYITAKILHDSILEQTTPLKNALTPLIDSGAKNRLKLTDTATTTKQGVTLTYNNDGTYTIDSAGSPSSGADFFYLARTSDNPIFPAGSVISGCTGGTDTTYRLQLAGTTIYQYDSAVTLPSDTSGSLIFYFAAGVTFNNLVIKPMVCSSADYALSPSFEPYCPTLAELYAIVKSYHP